MSYDQVPDWLSVPVNPWVRVQCCMGRAMPYPYPNPYIPVSGNTRCYLYPCHALQTRAIRMCGACQILVSGCFFQKIYAYLEASKATWCSSVYDHFDITLHCEMDGRGRPKILSFVFSCKVDPAHHSATICAQMSTGHGTENIQDDVKAHDKHVGTVTDTTTVESTVQPYSAAAHCILIAMWCAKNCCHFNSVLDKNYQAEVEMLCPGTILPGPQTVSCDIKSIYAKMSKKSRFISWWHIFYFNAYINKYMARLLTPPFIWSWVGG